MFPEGKTMYKVKDLIEHLQWANPDATVSARMPDGEDYYLSMDGASQDNVLLLFAPRHEFNDIRVYLKCHKCGRTMIESNLGRCWYCDGDFDIINKDYEEGKLDEKLILYGLFRRPY